MGCVPTGNKESIIRLNNFSEDELKQLKELTLAKTNIEVNYIVSNKIR